MLRTLAKCALILSIISMPSLEAKKPEDRDFNRFVEGSLEVYSQFEQPSKEESERFYDYVKSNWSSTECKYDCRAEGQKTAYKYVIEKDVKIKTKEK